MKPISGKQLAQIIERRGWILLRVNGSHHIYGRPGLQARLSIPVHKNQPLKAGLQMHLMKIAGLREEDI